MVNQISETLIPYFLRCLLLSDVESRFRYYFIVCLDRNETGFG
jgi:hypothetical protein